MMKLRTHATWSGSENLQLSANSPENDYKYPSIRAQSIQISQFCRNSVEIL